MPGNRANRSSSAHFRLSCRPNILSICRSLNDHPLKSCRLFIKGLTLPAFALVVAHTTCQQINLSLAATPVLQTPHRISTTSLPPSHRIPIIMSQQAPRQRLSLYTHRTLSHDVAAALKASSPLRIQTANLNFEPTPAPPPSPIDFGSYSSEFSNASEASEWLVRSPENSSQAVTA